MKSRLDNIVPLTELQRSSSKLAKRARESKEPIIITQHGRPALVLVDCKLYEELAENARNVSEGPPPVTNRERELRDELQRIVIRIVSEYQPEKIILFGSLAHGDVHEDSDIDLVIIKKTKKRFWDRQKEIARLVKPRLACDMLVYTPAEWKKTIDEGRPMFRDEMAEKGKIIYDSVA